MKWLCSTSRHCTNEGKFLIIPYNCNCLISKLWHFVEIFCVVIKWTGQPPYFTFITLFSMMNVHHSMFWINLLRVFRYPAIIYNLDIFESTLVSNSLTKKFHSKIKVPLDLQSFSWCILKQFLNFMKFSLRPTHIGESRTNYVIRDSLVSQKIVYVKS